MLGRSLCTGHRLSPKCPVGLGLGQVFILTASREASRQLQPYHASESQGLLSSPAGLFLFPFLFLVAGKNSTTPSVDHPYTVDTIPKSHAIFYHACTFYTHQKGPLGPSTRNSNRSQRLESLFHHQPAFPLLQQRHPACASGPVLTTVPLFTTLHCSDLSGSYSMLELTSLRPRLR
jgi:hypothetical protein